MYSRIFSYFSSILSNCTKTIVLNYIKIPIISNFKIFRSIALFVLKSFSETFERVSQVQAQQHSFTRNSSITIEEFSQSRG